MLRSLCFLALIALPARALAQDDAPVEYYPERQATITVSYNPEQGGIFKNLDDVKVVYVANFWNTRSGTRLALRENIRRPDSSRLMTAPLVKSGASWTAELEAPRNAGVISYYITDGETVDDNNGTTFTVMVRDIHGNPVPNAHYFMVPFLELAGADLETRVRKAEEEIIAYPENFRAYTQYFTLALQLERGSRRIQLRIVHTLEELEKKYGDADDCMNLIARTYYYVLRDQARGLAFKGRIPQSARWREVEAMFDSQALTHEQRADEQRAQKAREALLNAEAPPVRFRLSDGRISVQDLAGKPVVLVFWASTSDRSRQLFGPLADLLKKYRSQGLTVLAVNVGENQETVDAFTAQNNAPFTWALNDGAAIALYSVDGLPQTFLIDKKGVIRKVFAGYIPAYDAQLESGIKHIL